ncbi:hypothetical protein PSPO01_15239 [Paraphaeosphaeria sporulosa]
MPKAPPRDKQRAFRTRTDGIFKKASELFLLDDEVKVSILIETPGNPAWVFFTTGNLREWPDGREIEEMVKVSAPTKPLSLSGPGITLHSRKASPEAKRESLFQ